MTKQPPITFETLAERKSPTLPIFLVLPQDIAERARLEQTELAELILEAGGRWEGIRSLKPWPNHGWFLELNEKIRQAAGIEVGANVQVSLVTIGVGPPPELDAYLVEHPEARERWEALTSPQRRMLTESLLEARRPATRSRRIEKALG